ncbi:hypothetical protein DFH09DRAFT_1165249 [Mycena vulgaris]|nr:hypothetical protein DFH09DRAFT_1165249 [Mycena vulgaris]
MPGGSSRPAGCYRLPSLDSSLEITAEIFLQCLAYSQDENPAPYSSPKVLLSICSKWRAIVLSIPALWATLHLDFDHHLPQTFFPERD